MVAGAFGAPVPVKQRHPAPVWQAVRIEVVHTPRVPPPNGQVMLDPCLRKEVAHHGPLIDHTPMPLPAQSAWHSGRPLGMCAVPCRTRPGSLVQSGRVPVGAQWDGPQGEPHTRDSR